MRAYVSLCICLYLCVYVVMQVISEPSVYTIPLLLESDSIVCIYSPFVYTERRLHDFLVGLTNTHPKTFPYKPIQTSVLTHLEICYNYTGDAELMMPLNCSQPTLGRFLVITIPEKRVQMRLAEVIVLGM